MTEKPVATVARGNDRDDRSGCGRQLRDQDQAAMKGTMMETTKTTTTHIPENSHDLFSNCSPEVQAIYANTYGLIWRDGGKNAATLQILTDHAVAFMAVIGSAEAWCDSLGPRPQETEAIALACARMFALLESIREINPQCHTLDRKALGAQWKNDGIEEIVPENYASAAKGIREAVGKICFQNR